MGVVTVIHILPQGFEGVAVDVVVNVVRMGRLGDEQQTVVAK